VTRLVYDFGMYNGDDVEYYLKKGHDVVAVEANPKLCQLCEFRFADEIKNGRLSVLNVALTDGASSGDIDFYIHKTHYFLSQLLKPTAAEIGEFDLISVPQRKASSIVQEYGSPHYVKIDVEGIDFLILKDLFEWGIKPEFISAEAHSVRVFAMLVAGGYGCFNLVDGRSVSSTYGDSIVKTTEGVTRHSFREHSAGPYGEDLKSPWLDSDSFFYLLASEELGWKDIHASKTTQPIFRRHRKTLSFTEHLADLAPSLRRAIKFRLGLVSSSRS
jgi:FkbM family methyltransferase